MRSKLALTALLATGVLMGGASAAMGASALSTATDASALQYGSANVPVSTIGSSVPVAALGQSSGPTENNANEPTENNANEALNAGSGPETVAARQVAAAQGELPFTGYAPIPILLAGVLLLGLGVVLRRRNAQPSRP